MNGHRRPWRSAPSRDVDLRVQQRYGRCSRRNKSQVTTLAWAMPMPPPPCNFASRPHIDALGDRQLATCV